MMACIPPPALRAGNPCERQALRPTSLATDNSETARQAATSEPRLWQAATRRRSQSFTFASVMTVSSEVESFIVLVISSMSFFFSSALSDFLYFLVVYLTVSPLPPILASPPYGVQIDNENSDRQ